MKEYVMISVSEVEVTDDLRFAKIYLSFYNMNSQNNKNHFKVIKENKNIIKYKLGKQLRTKYVPKIDFILSDEFSNYDKINKISKDHLK